MNVDALQAALLPKGSTDRLLVVAAFAQSGGAAALKTHKCLNSVMGETFEVCKIYMAPALYGRITLRGTLCCLMHACSRKDKASIPASGTSATLILS